MQNFLNTEASVITNHVNDLLKQLHAQHSPTNRDHPALADLAELGAGLQQFCQILARLEDPFHRDSLDKDELTSFADYGFQLFQKLLQREEQTEVLRMQTRALMLASLHCLAKSEAILPQVDEFVNQLALFANQTQDNPTLMLLSQYLPDFIAAMPEMVKADMENMNPGRAWRVIHLNYAIVATRSHDAEQMDIAFQYLVDNLPHEAQGFFEEGMKQMDIVNYPDSVRKVMARYHALWHTDKVLH